MHLCVQVLLKPKFQCFVFQKLNNRSVFDNMVHEAHYRWSASQVNELWFPFCNCMWNVTWRTIHKGISWCMDQVLCQVDGFP